MQLRVKLLSSTALAAAALIGATSASAQDVGELTKRVEALEKAGGGQYVARSKKTMDLVVSGHVNQKVSMIDSGNASAFNIAGNNQSQTRFRFIGTGKISDDLAVRTQIELGNTSGLGNAENAQGGSQGTFTIRQMDIKVTSKSIGSFVIGDSSLATDGYHVAGDLSGMGIIQDSGDEGLFGAQQFRNSTTGAAITSIGNVFSNLDAGRRDHIGYDSPSFAGFQLNASYANEDDTNVGLRYGGDFGGVKVKAGIAYDVDRSGAGNDTINGSVGVLLPFGLNFFLSAADQDPEASGGRDQDRIYARIGYMFNATELGQTRIGLAWGQHDDRNAAGDEGERWSIAIVQVIEPLGAEVYAGYHNFSLDRTGVSVDDIDAVTAGLRVSF
jgi:predicted porin